MKRIRKYLKNGLLDIRNTLILGIYMGYFALVLFPIILVYVSINYTILAILELNWKELKKIYKKTLEVLDKIVVVID